MCRKLACLLLVVLASCAILAGCRKDSEIDPALAELDSFTRELVKKVESAPDPSAGVDEAQKFLDSRKADLASKVASIKDPKGLQASDETRKKVLEGVTDNVLRVSGLQIKYLDNRDPVFKAKLDKLVSDYNSLLR
jgi:hypothetical protein